MSAKKSVNKEAGLRQRKRFKRNITDSTWTKNEEESQTPDVQLDQQVEVEDASPPQMPTFQPNIPPTDSASEHSDEINMEDDLDDEEEKLMVFKDLIRISCINFSTKQSTSYWPIYWPSKKFFLIFKKL